MSVMGCRSAFETNNGPIRFDHERVELIKGIDTPNGKAHFVVARETPINADMRVIFPAMTKCGRGAFLFRTDKQAIQCNRALTIVPNQTWSRCPRIASSNRCIVRPRPLTVNPIPPANAK